jgi:integrase
MNESPDMLKYKIYPLNQDMAKPWFVEFSLGGGKRVKKYGHMASMPSVKDRLKECQRIIKDMENQQAGVPAAADKRDWIHLVEQAFENRVVYLRPKSVSTYRSKVMLFLKWYRFNADKPNTRQMGLGLAFVQHLKQLNLSHTTINAYKATLKTIFKDIKQVRPNPFEDIRKLKESRKSYRYFDYAQQVSLSSVIPEQSAQLWMACQFQFYLLLRPDELRTIRVGAFNLRTGTVCVDGAISKNGKTQFVKIPENFIKQLQFLEKYPPHFFVFGSGGHPGLVPRSKKYFPDLHQKILKENYFNLKEHKFYSWKHTGAAMYYMATGDTKGLKEQGRWHSLDMVDEYLKNLGVMDIQRLRDQFPEIAN